MFDPKTQGHPVESIEWVDAEKLSKNNYNPNRVQSPELRLLEYSILKNGWIQPILVSKDYTIIDGFHRATLAKTSKKVQEITGGKVPVVVMDISEAERIMLTIRINRAKGTHMAFKMADNIKSLIEDHKMSDEDIMEGIGCNRSELDLLKEENVFKRLDVENTPYSKAWYPSANVKKKEDA